MRGKQGGTIVMIGSASSIKAAAQASAYYFGKAAVRMLVKAAALELKPEGIRVNGVSPAGVVTPMWRKISLEQLSRISLRASDRTRDSAVGFGRHWVPDSHRLRPSRRFHLL